MKLAITGHRSENCESEAIVRGRLREVFNESRPDFVIVGMANGVDLWAGDEAIDLGINVVAAKPWAGHKPRKSDVELYSKVIASAKHVINVCLDEDYPGPWVYQKRNEYMVDKSDEVLAYWNGVKKGGTWNCIDYATGKKPIRNIYG